MIKDHKSYSGIIKATSIFGGVQVVNIIIQIIRSKLIALLLGPAGMGINSILNSTIGLMEGFTNFGLRTSGVKNISEANASGDDLRISTIIIVIRRWVWFTGMFGTLITILISSWLSEIAFGNNDYAIAIACVAITILFNQVSGGQKVILQGLRKIKHLANAGISGSVIGLIISIPIYYYFRIEGIVPAIIIISIANMILSWYFSKNINFKTIKVTIHKTIIEGKEMLIMGFMLSLSGLITLGSTYILRIFISNIGGIEQVGLYGVGITILNTYVGMVFTAMSTDYYPRLASVAKNNEEAKAVINQQAEVALLILAPIINIFLVFINIVILILYSSKFIAINEMIQWAALGIFFKAVSWSMGFMFIANGDSKVFFYKELFVNIIIIICNISGYYYYGLEGLGVSYLIGYTINFIIVCLIVYNKYNIKYEKELFVILFVHLLLSVICFVIVKCYDKYYVYSIGSFIIVISTYYSFYEFNKRLDLKHIITMIKRKYNK